MASESSRIENIYFRVVGLQPKLLQEFRECVVGHELETATYRNTDTLVVSIKIQENYNYNDLHNYLSFNIDRNKYGIYISLVTDRDNDGVHLPEYVLDFYSVIGGNIDFSFVCG